MSRSKKNTVSKLKKKAWSLCSQYIRLKYSHNGLVSCYTCGLTKPIKEMQAGHGFSGRGKAVLFMEDIIRPQCYGCNVCNSGKLDVFAYQLQQELGKRKFNKLYLIAHQSQGQWTITELEKIVDKYKKLLRTMEDK